MRSKTVRALGAVAMTVAVTPAFAADLYAPPPEPIYESARPALMWSGPYIGVNAGFASGHERLRETSATPFNGTDFERWRARSEGFTGGAQIGFNRQFGNIVLGLEADFNYVDNSRTRSSPSGAVTASVSDGFIGTVRPRLGFAWGPWLFYGTGGLAYGTADTTLTGNGPLALSASNTDWRVGWTAGGGIEYALSRNWTVRAEYLHFDLGSATVSGLASDGNTYSWRSHLTDDVVRMGVNYRF